MKNACNERYFEILEKQRNLPVWLQKEEFLQAFKENQIVILVGETGSGKSTQIPQFVLEAIVDESPNPSGRKWLVGCTQPRRVAAMSVSRRVAEEMDVEIGKEVGYTVRFEDCSSSETVLKYLTDDMLVTEAITDPLLKKYKVIVLDEVHERSIATDLLSGLLKHVMINRPDLKLVVMTATLEDTNMLCRYFSDAPLIKVPSSVHPVEISYTLDPKADYIEAAINTVIQIHKREPPGDVLVFLTGEEEIEDACSRIAEKLGDQVKVLPLYSTLPPALQQRLFDPTPHQVRKIIVSTDIAETSLTIDGIVYVVDPGFVMQNIYYKQPRVESLLVTPISQVSADQRAACAGRTRPGKCFRLYTEKSFNHDLQRRTCPEILRSNLAKNGSDIDKTAVE